MEDIDRGNTHLNLVVRPVVGSCRVTGDSHGDFLQTGRPEGGRKQPGRKEIVMLLGIVREEGESGNL